MKHLIIQSENYDSTLPSFLISLFNQLSSSQMYQLLTFSTFLSASMEGVSSFVVSVDAATAVVGGFL